MRRRQKTDYSMLIIMLPFCVMIELGKVAFQIIGLLLSALTAPRPTRRPQKRTEPRTERRTAPRKSEPKEKKPLAAWQIEKYRSEIRKAEQNIAFLEYKKDYFREQLEDLEAEEDALPQTITINGKEIPFQYSQAQIDLFREIGSDEPSPKADKERQKILKQLNTIETRLITERSKIRQNRMKLKGVA